MKARLVFDRSIRPHLSSAEAESDIAVNVEAVTQRREGNQKERARADYEVKFLR
jgi:hypothetical protein